MKRLLKYTSVKISEDAETGKGCVSRHLNKSSSKKSSGDDITTKIHLALWPKLDIELFLLLLEQQPAELNKPSGILGDTLLHRAVRHGLKKIVTILIDKRANVDAQNAYGQTPLHIACQLQQADIAKTLADAGADVNIADVSGDAPIHLACKGGSIPILQLMMEKSICSEDGCEGYLGNSLLHYAAQYGHTEMMKYLLDNEDDPNACNFLGETPLHLAAGAHLKNVGTKHLELLLERGAKLNARTHWGDTAAHYAALNGSLEVLTFLCHQGVSLIKPKDSKVDRALCLKLGLSEDDCNEMEMTFLQKVAKSSCINKSTFVLDNIMCARRIIAYNQSASFFRSSDDRKRIFRHTEMSEQQREFKMMAVELHQDMNQKNSALRLFLKHSPDCIDHLLNQCLVSFCGSDQVQGFVSYDFFLFFPTSRVEEEELGELAIVKVLLESRKERFLTHPIFETFLKLKWYRTWKMYMVILLLYAGFVTAVLGYSLTHFGNVLEQPLDVDERNFWWYFLVIATTYVGSVEVVKIVYGMFRCYKQPRLHYKFFANDTTFACHMVFMELLETSIPVLCALMLSSSLEAETRRYISAVVVILSCFFFMLALGRLPRIGIYIFMLNKVFDTIMNFFISYFWHFLGYAIAFHILMPIDGPFSSLGNSIIKVLTMLMGEYDFTENFANDETFWVTKLIFVIFVIDMSVVLMNLVLGLAVNDVESILQDSKVRRMVHEAFTVEYLEKICLNLAKLPCFPNAFSQMRITSSNTCQFKEVVYLNLVDIVHNEGNEIVIDRSMMGGERTVHACPDTVAQSVVAILKNRLKVTTSKSDHKTELIISDLREQNAFLRQKMENVEGQLDTLLTLVNDLHKKLP